MEEKIADNIEYYDKNWYPVVLQQEAILKFNNFNREDAFKLGNSCVDIGRKKYKKEIAVKIFMDGCTVYSAFMNETGLRNDWWISCKANTVRKTGVSSLHSLLERALGDKKFEPWCYDANSYFLCGGGFPIRDDKGNILAIIVVSALKHEEDHQLIVDALSEMIHIETPSVL